MKKIIVALCAAAFAVAFAGCVAVVRPSEEYLALEERNAELYAQVAELEERLERAWEANFDPVNTSPTCGLTWIEIVEDEAGLLTLSVQVCLIARTRGFMVSELPPGFAENRNDPSMPEGLGRYLISLVHVSGTNSWGINPFFTSFFFDHEAHALQRTPERLERANIRFLVIPLTRDEYQIIISSDLPMGIDKERIDAENLSPHPWREDLYYHANVGEAWSNLRFEIPITIGE